VCGDELISYALVNAGLAGDEVNIARGMTARQISTYISPAGAALDGKNSTASCTDNKAGHPWWSVDLGQSYSVTRVTVIAPDLDGYRNYHHTTSCA